MRRAGAAALLLLAACRGEQRSTDPSAQLARLVDSLIPAVERSTGLTLKHPPRARLVTRAQAQAYIAHNLQRQLEGGRGQHIATSYRLLGLVADSVDLQRLLLAVLGEQVAGYYDPDSGAFFGVEGASPEVLRLTVGHELVHALQHDYVPLDSIVDDFSDADRAVAAHSVLEGQATLAMFRMTPQIGDQVLEQSFWDEVRRSAAEQMRGMPQLAAAPRVLQEGVVFPYFAGAEYMRWWALHHREDEFPYGDRMPRSSEEILAPERAANGDRPWKVTFVAGDSALHADGLGAMEMRVLLADARGSATLDDAAVLGWGGDHFELYGTPGGEALVWVAVFDSPPARDRALQALAEWPRTRAGYRRAADRLEVSGRPGLRLTVAPEGWVRWRSLPTAKAVQQ